MSTAQWPGPVIVYRISVERGKFQEVRLRDPASFLATFSSCFDGHRMKDTQHPIPCSIDDPSKPIADFSYLRPGTFVFTPRADGDFIDLYKGQLIPLDVDGELRYAVNVTQVTSSLNIDRCIVTQRDEGSWKIERYSFLPNRLGPLSIFKIMQTRCVEILCYSGFNNSVDDEFPLYYRQRELTGLTLQPLWSLQS